MKRPAWLGRGLAKFGAVAALLLGLVLVPTAASAAPGFDEFKLTASDAAPGDDFGVSVAVSGDTIVVGAVFDDDKGALSGSAYVFQSDGAGGYAETKLTASDATPGDLFGSSVAVSGDTIVVGARGDDDNVSESGSAYVYEPDGVGGYTETKLTATDAAANDYFGWSVAVSGDTIVVSAPGSDDNGSLSGSAYVYEPDGNGGYTETKLTASDAAALSWFGYSLGVSGDTIVVGAYHDDEKGSQSGSAYVYEPDGIGGYTETKLTASDAAADDGFGISAAVSGDTIVVGAHGNDDHGARSGSVYVYEPGGVGTYIETKLTASDGSAQDLFGWSVAMSGDTIVVAASYDDDDGSESGSAYVYEPDGMGGYTETKLTASDAAAHAYFGYSVAVSGATVVVGAFLDDDSGSAYVYTPTVSDSDGDGIDDDVDNCPGIANADQANLDGDDDGDACDDDIDGDGVANHDDALPFDPTESADNDGDGIGDNADVDDDNDGQTDTDETACGSNPLDAASVSPDLDSDNIPDCVDPDTVVDSDNDGVSNADDICADTVLPDEPTRQLGFLRFAAQENGTFDAGWRRLDGKFTIADTAGCSGTQIIEKLGLGQTDTRYGISYPALVYWIYFRA
ncbi:FG-GAP repeat protein [Ilumatobacter sp.]|uniref:FG-GAP repeat protein n=1 Tax=Ilumatobacter sp. TaxID=1967498 RepID=UPI003C4E9E51